MVRRCDCKAGVLLFLRLQRKACRPDALQSIHQACGAWHYPSASGIVPQQSGGSDKLNCIDEVVVPAYQSSNTADSDPVSDGKYPSSDASRPSFQDAAGNRVLLFL